MKELQNNFTTPEQSKKLLDLGVPADSADCVLENLDTAENNFQSEYYTRWIIEKRHVKEDIFCERNEGIFLPCWSVGRLIEIYDICRYYDGDYDNVYGKETYIETFISAIEEAILDDMLDFSKLEE